MPYAFFSWLKLFHCVKYICNLLFDTLDVCPFLEHTVSIHDAFVHHTTILIHNISTISRLFNIQNSSFPHYSSFEFFPSDLSC